MSDANDAGVYASLAPLQATSIRLLQLQPSKTPQSPLHASLFHYSLQSSSSCPYEALSYTWGTEHKPDKIRINDEFTVSITHNLYVALQHLRFDVFPRLLWIDAVCIDQDNRAEKESQIPLMPEIYARAQQVLVWLGEASDGAGRALDSLRRLGESAEQPDPSQYDDGTRVVQYEGYDGYDMPALKRLFRRPWFHRVWVLQEMAAARHIIIMAGSTRIDGHALSLGVATLYDAATLYETLDIRPQVIFLISGAIFRSRDTIKKSGRVSLDICPLAQLLDMYSGHKATQIHDRLYALLGMSSDRTSDHGIEPDYTVPWKTLVARLTRYLLGNEILIQARNSRTEIYIRSTAIVLGSVIAVYPAGTTSNEQSIDVKLVKDMHQLDPYLRWKMTISGKAVQDGDIVCLLYGRSTPSIFRLCKDHLVLVVIAAPLEPDQHPPPERMRALFCADEPGKEPTDRRQDISFVWDWDHQDGKNYSEAYPDRTEDGVHVPHDHQSRIWEVVSILRTLREIQLVTDLLNNAANSYQCDKGRPELPGDSLIYYLDGLTQLIWAASHGNDSMVTQLLRRKTCDIEASSNVYGTALAVAAKNGHERTAELLVSEGGADMNARDFQGRTPLIIALRGGHMSVADRLVEYNADLWAQDSYNNKVICHASGAGHLSFVKLLLQDGLAIKSLKLTPHDVQMSFLEATKNNRLEIVKYFVEEYDDIRRLLYDAYNEGARRKQDGSVPKFIRRGLIYKWRNFDINDRDGESGRTPLLWAVTKGHEEVTKILLDTNQVDVNRSDSSGETPLIIASRSGHIGVLRLLLGSKNIDVDAGDRERLTALWHAVDVGAVEVVRLLLDTRKVDVKKGPKDFTPLQRAKWRGRDDIVQVLEAYGGTPATRRLTKLW